MALPVLAYAWVSEVAETARLSGDVPSPQSTVKLVTVALLVTVNVTVTVSPVLAGFGVGLLTVTAGTPTGVWTIIDAVPCPMLPLLSVAATVIVKPPADA